MIASKQLRDWKFFSQSCGTRCVEINDVSAEACGTDDEIGEVLVDFGSLQRPLFVLRVVQSRSYLSQRFCHVNKRVTRISRAMTRITELQLPPGVHLVLQPFEIHVSPPACLDADNGHFDRELTP